MSSTNAFVDFDRSSVVFDEGELKKLEDAFFPEHSRTRSGAIRLGASDKNKELFQHIHLLSPQERFIELKRYEHWLAVGPPNGIPPPFARVQDNKCSDVQVVDTRSAVAMRNPHVDFIDVDSVDIDGETQSRLQSQPRRIKIEKSDSKDTSTSGKDLETGAGDRDRDRDRDVGFNDVGRGGVSDSASASARSHTHNEHGKHSTRVDPAAASAATSRTNLTPTRTTENRQNDKRSGQESRLRGSRSNSDTTNSRCPSSSGSRKIDAQMTPTTWTARAQNPKLDPPGRSFDELYTSFPWKSKQKEPSAVEELEAEVDEDEVQNDEKENSAEETLPNAQPTTEDVSMKTDELDALKSKKPDAAEHIPAESEKEDLDHPEADAILAETEKEDVDPPEAASQSEEGTNNARPGLEPLDDRIASLLSPHRQGSRSAADTGRSEARGTAGNSVAKIVRPGFDPLNDLDVDADDSDEEMQTQVQGGSKAKGTAKISVANIVKPGLGPNNTTTFASKVSSSHPGARATTDSSASYCGHGGGLQTNKGSSGTKKFSFGATRRSDHNASQISAGATRKSSMSSVATSVKQANSSTPNTSKTSRAAQMSRAVPRLLTSNNSAPPESAPAGERSTSYVSGEIPAFGGHVTVAPTKLAESEDKTAALEKNLAEFGKKLAAFEEKNATDSSQTSCATQMSPTVLRPLPSHNSAPPESAPANERSTPHVSGEIPASSSAGGLSPVGPTQASSNKEDVSNDGSTSNDKSGNFGASSASLFSSTTRPAVAANATVESEPRENNTRTNDDRAVLNHTDITPNQSSTSIGFLSGDTSDPALSSTKRLAVSGDSDNATDSSFSLPQFERDGDQHMRNGEFDQAAEAYSQICMYPLNRSKTHIYCYKLAEACLNQNEIYDAIFYFKTSIRFRPDYAEAHFRLGHAYYLSGSFGQAIEEYALAVEGFESSLKQNPDDSTVRMWLEDATIAMGLATQSKDADSHSGIPSGAALAQP